VIDFNYAQTLFNYLYGNINGYKVSTQARKNSGLDTEKLLYGELPFETWREMVERVNPKKDGVFFDLGSGTGRVVVQSHLLFDFKKCVGVELLEGLHNKALEVQKEFEKSIEPQILTHVKDRQLSFLNASIFDTDLSEADLILMNHPFKDGELFLQLEEKFLRELKPKTKIITIIRALRNKAFKSLGSQSFKFSWGDSTAHFFEV
jgi:ABC-type lipoprotein release transport system permease subunit